MLGWDWHLKERERKWKREVASFRAGQRRANIVTRAIVHQQSASIHLKYHVSTLDRGPSSLLSSNFLNEPLLLL